MERHVETDTEHRGHKGLSDGRAGDCWSPQGLAADQPRTETLYDGTDRDMQAKVLEAKLRVRSHSLPN